MKTIHHRLNNVVGQLLGAARMIDDQEDCQKVMIQLKAAGSALDKLTAEYLKQNINSCLGKTTKPNREKVEKLIDRLASL